MLWILKCARTADRNPRVTQPMRLNQRSGGGEWAGMVNVKKIISFFFIPYGNKKRRFDRQGTLDIGPDGMHFRGLS
jgi:hypothetical protein